MGGRKGASRPRPQHRPLVTEGGARGRLAQPRHSRALILSNFGAFCGGVLDEGVFVRGGLHPTPLRAALPFCGGRRRAAAGGDCTQRHWRDIGRRRLAIAVFMQ